MALFDGLFTGTTTQQPLKKDPFAGLFQVSQQPAPPPPTQPQQPQQEGWFSSVGGFFKNLNNTVQDLAWRSPLSSAADAVTTAAANPDSAFKGAVVGAVVDFPLQIAKGLSSLVGQQGAVKYIQENQDAITEIFNSNLADKDDQTAGAVGRFIGEQVPYLVAAGAASQGLTAVAASGLARVGGGLSMNAVQKIGVLTKAVSNAAGFMGLDQLIYTPDQGTRAEVVKKDLLVLGTIESLSAGLGVYRQAKALQRLRTFLDDVKVQKPPLPTLERGVNTLKTEITQETGKTPQQLLQIAYNEPKLLGSPKTGQPIYGNGFIAKDAATKQEIARAKAFTAYNDAVDKFNAKPTPQNLKKVVDAKKARQGFLEAEPAAVSPTIQQPIQTARPSLPVQEASQPTVTGAARAPLQPIGEGTTKTVGLSAGVEANAIEKKLTTGFGDLPEYRQVNMKDQAEKAASLLSSDYAKARRVALGQEPAPQGIIPESVFVAVENKAVKEGDVATLRELATQSKLTTEATAMGQRIRTLAERDPESPIGAIQDVVKARTEAAARKVGDIHKARQKVVSQIQKEVEKVAPTEETWTTFVQSLKC